MKSLVEEASSIAKAIEKAWERAGKPQSFSVKIYETGEKNFLGFTKKPAKVGIFFEEEFTRTNDRRPYAQNHTNNRPQKNHSNSYTNRLERSAENSERSTKNTSQENRTPHRQNQKMNRPTEERSEIIETRAESNPENRHDNKNDSGRYVREKNRETNKRNENRYEKTSDRRNHGRRNQKQSNDNNESNHHKEPLVQSYPHAEINSQEISTPVHIQNPAPEKPVMAIPVGQTQRKILKVSSRRYTGNKPTEQSKEEIKTSSE